MTSLQATQDEFYMRRCFELAASFEARTSPNPRVGCVIVKNGRVLAEGVHRGAGTPHAEADALAKLGGKATGATLYVNLEPCNHYGRTPPCAPAVAKSGVVRVVAGMADPIASHAGGFRLLRRSGVQVTSNVLQADAQALNAGFICVATKHRPHITLKAGMSLDGRTATRKGESKWITSETARTFATAARAHFDAIVAGVNTILADDPRLTARVGAGRAVPQPIRVIVDSKARMPAAARVLKERGTTIVAVTEAASSQRVSRLTRAGADVVVLPSVRGRVALPSLFALLAERGCCNVLVEGGATLHAACLAANVVDALELYIAPKVIGEGATWSGPFAIGKLTEAPLFRLVATQELGCDMLLTYAVAPRLGQRRSRRLNQVI